MFDLLLFVVLGVLVVLAPFVVLALTTPVSTRWTAEWEPGVHDPKPFKVKRRWFPWFSTNVTFGGTIYEGGAKGLNTPTLRHEATHVRQYRTRGIWWVWTHPQEREAEAHAAENATYPKLTLLV